MFNEMGAGLKIQEPSGEGLGDPFAFALTSYFPALHPVSRPLAGAIIFRLVERPSTGDICVFDVSRFNVVLGAN